LAQEKRFLLSQHKTLFFGCVLQISEDIITGASSLDKNALPVAHTDRIFKVT